ncbi:MAG TPA: class I SAM-dependent methyltransferase [Thermoanaerobaculia bacterium]|nr:class I SAM-dependent methyltransferase [Thermoanaerobaculia bacterium]
MSAMVRLVMQKFYRQAQGQPEKLPWHQEAPPVILEKVVRARGGRGRALDVGCGAGVFSVWMAEQGLEVTGIDMFPEATAMARARAEQHGVQLELVTGDLFEYTPPQPFDLVYDSGCLHSLVGGSVARYEQQLLRWLARGGDYVLGHWGKRHAFDWRPIGPRRRSEAAIRKIFTPELTLRETEVHDFETPLPFGPVVRGVGYWFRR